jgi:hypothetical protein
MPVKRTAVPASERRTTSASIVDRSYVVEFEAQVRAWWCAAVVRQAEHRAAQRDVTRSGGQDQGS